MNLILDTNAILYLTLDATKLSTLAAYTLAEPSHRPYVSPASYWEMAVKMCIGKLVLNAPFEAYWERAFAIYRFQILPIELRHANLLTTLQLHHRDPFDRLLVAQSLVDNLPLVSSDSVLTAYGIQRMW